MIIRALMAAALLLAAAAPARAEEPGKPASIPAKVEAPGGATTPAGAGTESSGGRLSVRPGFKAGAKTSDAKGDAGKAQADAVRKRDEAALARRERQMRQLMRGICSGC